MTETHEPVTSGDLAKLMNRALSLVGLAEQPGLDPEAASKYRQRAETLMRQYREAEEHLIAIDQVEIAPEVHAIWLGPHKDPTRGDAGGRDGRAGVSYYQQWYDLARAAAIHAGVKIGDRWGRNTETGEYGIFAVFVGYAGDLRMAEIIYTNARIVFGEKLEPKPKPELSDQENAYRLRSAGITRDRVAILLWGSTNAARAAKVGALYKAECLARGERPVLNGNVNAELYRDQFANGFVDELETRLWRARDAADRASGGALVLHGRAERVLEAFYNEFPERRPKPKTEVAERETAVEETPKRKGRQKLAYWETAAYRREQERLHSGVAAIASKAGRAAAREIPLDRASDAQRLGQEAPRSVAGELEG